MIIVLIPLVVLPVLLILYLYRLAWMTRPANQKLRLALRRTYGGAVLAELDGPGGDFVRQRMTRQQRAFYSRQFMGGMMPKIYAEAQRMTRAAGHPLALWHFAVFHFVYRLLEFKLRYAASAEASILRWSARGAA